MSETTSQTFTLQDLKRVVREVFSNPIEPERYKVQMDMCDFLSSPLKEKTTRRSRKYKRSMRDSSVGYIVA